LAKSPNDLKRPEDRSRYRKYLRGKIDSY